MSWTSRSEYRFTGCMLSAATVDLLVVNEGVWHSAHPVLVNWLLPLAIELAPPGVSGEGIGGARKRMKIENCSMSLSTWNGVVASMLVTLFGTVANWQLRVSSRSVWKISLVIPCSTLYASPANKSSDLFCAFQPKRAMVPSLPFLLVMPVIVRPATWKFALPLIPNACFWEVLPVCPAAIAASGICSINPAPKVGVGMRKITLLFLSA